MCVLFLLSPHHRVPVQSERWSGAALHLSVSREGAGGGSNGSPVARHNEVGPQRTHKSIQLLAAEHIANCLVFLTSLSLSFFSPHTTCLHEISCKVELH